MGMEKRAWKRMNGTVNGGDGRRRLLVESVRARTVIFVVVPEPLDQVTPSNPVHVIRGAVFSIQHLASVRPPAAGAVYAFTEIGDFHREDRVAAGVPRIHQWVCRELGYLVAYHTYHPVHPHVAVRGFHGLQAGNVVGYGEGVRARAGAELGGVSDPRVRQRVADNGRKSEVMKPADVVAEILNVDIVGGEQQVDAALRING